MKIAVKEFDFSLTSPDLPFFIARVQLLEELSPDDRPGTHAIISVSVPAKGGLTLDQLREEALRYARSFLSRSGSARPA